jgi:hypothetical protein
VRRHLVAVQLVVVIALDAERGAIRADEASSPCPPPRMVKAWRCGVICVCPSSTIGTPYFESSNT